MVGTKVQMWARSLKRFTELLVIAVFFVVVGAANAAERMISTLAGGSKDGVPSKAWISSPEVIVVDEDGSVFFTEIGFNSVRKLDARTGKVTTIGDGKRGFRGDGGPAENARFAWPWGLALDSRRILYVADFGNQRIRAINLSDRTRTVCKVRIKPGEIETIAGSGVATFDVEEAPGEGIPALQTTMAFPRGITVDQNGDVYYADVDNIRIRRVVAATGKVETFAGSGQCEGYPSDNHEGGVATQVNLCAVTTIVIGPDRNFYVGEWGFAPDQGIDTGVYWKIDRNSKIMTRFAGIGTANSGGEGQLAVNAGLHGNPKGHAFDEQGNMFISDFFSIRRVDAKTGIITTVAGNPDQPDLEAAYSSGDVGGPPTEAQIVVPSGFAFHDGSLYFGEEGTGSLRRIDPGDVPGITGPNDAVHPDTSERLQELGPFRTGIKQPFAMCVDAVSNVYVGENWYGRIRKVDPHGRVTGLFNNASVRGLGGENGPAKNGQGGWVASCTFDEQGDLYFVDAVSRRILRIKAVASGDGPPLVSPESTLEKVLDSEFFVHGIAVVGGKLYMAASELGEVWRYDLTTHDLVKLVDRDTPVVGGPDEPPLGFLLTLAFDRQRNALYIADPDPARVVKLDLGTNALSVLAGPPEGRDFWAPVHIAMSGPDHLFVSDDSGLGQVFAVDLTAATPNPVPIAGSGPAFPPGSHGDLLPATEVLLNNPQGVGADAGGRLVLGERDSLTVRVVGLSDILPGEYPNEVDLESSDAIPVAILSARGFNAPAAIDAKTVRVAGARPLLGGNGRPRVREADVNGDGRIDLVVFVRPSQMQLASNATQASVRASRTGGGRFEDADWITPTGDRFVDRSSGTDQDEIPRTQERSSEYWRRAMQAAGWTRRSVSGRRHWGPGSPQAPAKR